MLAYAETSRHELSNVREVDLLFTMLIQPPLFKLQPFQSTNDRKDTHREHFSKRPGQSFGGDWT